MHVEYLCHWRSFFEILPDSKSMLQFCHIFYIGDKELDRLLKEISHIITMLPDMVGQLIPGQNANDMNLILQPLRNENSDLRRYGLFITNLLTIIT